jgi:hypothetical protein
MAGLLYIDEFGNYCPEMDWFEPDDNNLVRVCPISLKQDSTKEWWYSKLYKIADYKSRPLVELQIMAKSRSIMEKALLYIWIISYWGWGKFDKESYIMPTETAYKTIWFLNKG